MGKTPELNILWTIGVPFCPARRHWVPALYEDLLTQIDGNIRIELLLIGDNYARCASYKHRLMWELGQGHWVSWIQDDALISPAYVQTIWKHLVNLEAAREQADIVVFPCGFRYHGGREVHTATLTKWGGEGANPHGYNGGEACTPQFWHAWRRGFILPEWWEDDFNCDTALFKKARDAKPRLSQIECGVLYTYDCTVRSTNQNFNPSKWRQLHQRDP